MISEAVIPAQPVDQAVLLQGVVTAAQLYCTIAGCHVWVPLCLEVGLIWLNKRVLLLLTAENQVMLLLLLHKQATGGLAWKPALQRAELPACPLGGTLVRGLGGVL